MHCKLEPSKEQACQVHQHCPRCIARTTLFRSLVLHESAGIRESSLRPLPRHRSLYVPKLAKVTYYRPYLAQAALG